MSTLLAIYLVFGLAATIYKRATREQPSAWTPRKRVFESVEATVILLWIAIDADWIL